MADQTDFKHITVNPAESDDVVIHAGAPAQASGQEPPTGPAPSQHPDTGRASEAAQAGGPSPTSGKEAAKKPSSAKPMKPDASKEPAYRQTTLEDIQSFKMSKTQVAVIVVALAAIAAFVVWYLVFS